MKKIGLLSIVVIVIATIYYLTLGSTEIIEKMKNEVNSELQTLKQSGFSVEERKIEEKKERFVLDFNNTKKISNFFSAQGIEVNQADVALLKGLRVGVDLEYMPSIGDSVSFDVYPLKLPNSLYENITPEDKKSVKAIEEMIKEKTFLVHVDVNKLANGFSGYVKDIDRTFKDDGNISRIISKGFVFDAKVEDEKVKSMTQNLEKLSYSIKDALKIEMLGVETEIENNLDSKFTNVKYSVKNISMSDNNQTFSLLAKGISGLSKDKMDKGLISNQSQFSISSINLSNTQEQTLLNNLKLVMSLNNLNLETLAKLDNLSLEDLNDNSTLNQLLPLVKELSDNNISMNISDLSIEKIELNGESLNGLSIKATASLNEDVDWQELRKEPLKITALPKVKASLEVSNKINALFAQDPKSIVFMMLMQPIDNNGSKIYNLEFDKSSLKVNGKVFF